uniref:Uncharacterized protein n=1 Tax=Globisporangium ultimum (strain ATCC 200006 / CBS 805.95 / DAOM BR144) TaxID=431595 RepID=K3WSE3_GLOUD
MWNAALRRIVRDEEDREREKRVAMQQQMKKEMLASATTAAATSSVAASSATVAASEGASEEPSGAGESESSAASMQVDETSHDAVLEEAKHEEDDEEEDYIQRHLLSRPKSKWTCLEDSQQACCLAMNRKKTVFAVGEREGRISIWDNVSIRVITRELDPTLIIIPENSVAATDTAKDGSVQEANGSKAPATNETNGKDVTNKTEVREKAVSAIEVDAEDDSATNDDGSVEADEDEEVASAEDGDGNTEEEEDDEDEDDEDDEDDEKTRAAQMNKVLPKGASSMASTASKSSSDRAAGSGLSIEELRIVKESLKVVTYCAWSCDTRWLFAGCEEKSNRRGRLCVWDVDAATIFATFSFDAAINCVSAHPGDPDVVVVSYYNSLPVLLNVRTRVIKELAVPIINPTINTTVPANSRHPSLIVSAKFGTTGQWIYCATSKSTVAIFETATLTCMDSVTLAVLIQFVDLSIDYRESALILTSSKGVHEYSINTSDDASTSKRRSLSEVRAYATGAVRAPWALCCFSDDESYVVGMPVVRHRHVGENGLYTWHRGTGRVQHNPGVKDGVNSLAWDTQRESIVAVSTTGALFVLEEEFTTTWSGPMYPAGYRLITDNELHIASMDAELEAIAKAKKEQLNDGQEIDIFTIDEVPSIGPTTSVQLPHLRGERLEPQVKNELIYIPSIAISHHHKKHHHAFEGPMYHEEKHFGLGQSIFEPLKVGVKPKSSKSKRKSSSSSSNQATTDPNTGELIPPKKKSRPKARSILSSGKRRRR